MAKKVIPILLGRSVQAVVGLEIIEPVPVRGLQAVDEPSGLAMGRGHLAHEMVRRGPQTGRGGSARARLAARTASSMFSDITPRQRSRAMSPVISKWPCSRLS